MFTISKEVVPLSDPGGAGQWRQMHGCARWETTFRSGTDSLSYSAPEGWDFCHLFLSCCRQGNPHEFYITWQKPQH